MSVPDPDNESESSDAEVDPFEELGVQTNISNASSSDGLEAFMEDDEEDKEGGGGGAHLHWRGGFAAQHAARHCADGRRRRVAPARGQPGHEHDRSLHPRRRDGRAEAVEDGRLPVAVLFAPDCVAAAAAVGLSKL